MNLPEWLAKRHADIAAEQPLSLQTTIGALSQRLWAAESALDQIGRLHRPATRSGCAACTASGRGRVARSKHWRTGSNE